MDMNNPPTIFPLLDKIKQQSGIVRMTTGKEPTHIIVNGYTYHRLTGEMYAAKKAEANYDINPTGIDGLAIAVLPNDSSQEIKMEVL